MISNPETGPAISKPTPTLTRFGSVISNAIFEGINLEIKIQIITKTSTIDIKEIAFFIVKDISKMTGTEKIENTESAIIFNVREYSIGECGRSINIKKFVASTYLETFTQHHPDLLTYYPRCESHHIAGALMNRISFLKEKGKLSEYNSDQKDLEWVINRLVESTEDKTELLEVENAEAYIIMGLCASFWNKPNRLFLPAFSEKIIVYHSNFIILMSKDISAAHLGNFVYDSSVFSSSRTGKWTQKVYSGKENKSKKSIIELYTNLWGNLSEAQKWRVRNVWWSGLPQDFSPIYQAKTKDICCKEDISWPIRKQAESTVHMIDTSTTHVPLKYPQAVLKPQSPTKPKIIVTKGISEFEEQYDRCTYCSSKQQETINCIKLHDNSKTTLASWDVLDYEDHLQRKRKPYQMPMAFKIVQPATSRNKQHNDYVSTTFINIGNKAYNVRIAKANPVQQEFIIDSGAVVTVSHAKALINNIRYFGGIIIIDSGGNEHFTLGVGDISIGGHHIPCYWAPTLRVSVVSSKDLMDVSASVIFHSDGHVYITHSDLQSLVCFGKSANEHPILSIRFVGPDKQDINDAMSIHEQYAHTNERITRQICGQQNIPFKSADSTAIRNCETCFDIRYKSVSHKFSPSKATRILHRVHLHTTRYGNNSWITYITDEFSSYVWAAFSIEKDRLADRIKGMLQNINQENFPFKIVYVIKDNRTELPNVNFFTSELKAICEHAPSNTKVPGSRASYTKSIITLKALFMVTEVTKNDSLRKLLEPFALQHAVLVYNGTPTAKGFIPRDVLQGKSGRPFKNTLSFGMDVLVSLPQGKRAGVRKLKKLLIRGMYLGASTADGSIHSIWVNYHAPGQKMNVFKAENVYCTGTMSCMASAEERIAKSKRIFLAREQLYPPRSTSYNNPNPSRAHVVFSQECFNTRMAQLMTPDEAVFLTASDLVSGIPSNTENASSREESEFVPNITLDDITTIGSGGVFPAKSIFESNISKPYAEIDSRDMSHKKSQSHITIDATAHNQLINNPHIVQTRHIVDGTAPDQRNAVSNHAQVQPNIDTTVTNQPITDPNNAQTRTIIDSTAINVLSAELTREQVHNMVNAAASTTKEFSPKFLTISPSDEEQIAQSSVPSSTILSEDTGSTIPRATWVLWAHPTTSLNGDNVVPAPIPSVRSELQGHIDKLQRAIETYT